MHKYVISWLLAIALLGSIDPARALFHTFRINEIYSNADGTIQFIELLESQGASFQNLFAGITLTSGSGANRKTFVFPTNLPSSATAGKSVLIGTQGFAALGLVTPDYIIPNGFLSWPEGEVNFADVFTVHYTQLPVDGATSINQNGVRQTNSPMNFTGATASVPGSPFYLQSDCLFNWVESNYATFFAPSGTISIAVPQLYYRFYSNTGAYLGTFSPNNHVYYLGPVTGNLVADLGALSVWLAIAGCP